MLGHFARRQPARARGALRASNCWQKWEIELVRKGPDLAVARQTGRTLLAVQAKRRAAGICLRPWNSWNPWEIELLGKFPDREVVRRTGRKLSAVQSKREKIGIIYVRQRPWTKEELVLLGKSSDKEVARRIGRNYTALQFKRKKMGIPCFGCIMRDWSPKEDKLLGRFFEPTRFTRTMSAFAGSSAAVATADGIGCGFSRVIGSAR